MLNLNRCSFLAPALDFIRANPGCSKKDVILGSTCYRVSQWGRMANDTYAYRNASLNRLIRAGLVWCDTPVGRSGYALVAR